MLDAKMFGVRLRAELEAQGISQSAFARSLDLSQAAVANVIRNAAYPRMEIAVKMCNTLGVSMDYMLGADGYEGVVI